MSSLEGARIRLERLQLSGNTLAAQVASFAWLELHDGQVTGNEIGVNVQVEGFDIAALEDRVRYLDNARNPLPVGP